MFIGEFSCMLDKYALMMSEMIDIASAATANQVAELDDFLVS